MPHHYDGGIMAADYCLQLDGIKGESADSKHQGWIECTMVHWNIKQPKSATASTGGDFPTETLGLKFSKIKWKYTQQKISGGSSGNTAGGWDLATNRIA
jgi:type VI protein secretion system component Hcp